MCLARIDPGRAAFRTAWAHADVALQDSCTVSPTAGRWARASGGGDGGSGGDTGALSPSLGLLVLMALVGMVAVRAWPVRHTQERVPVVISTRILG